MHRVPAFRSEYINPNWTRLHSSRGLEDPRHKVFMRSSVMATMCLLYAPAVLLLLWGRAKSREGTANLFRFLAALCYPGLIFVDNGHFQ